MLIRLLTDIICYCGIDWLSSGSGYVSFLVGESGMR